MSLSLKALAPVIAALMAFAPTAHAQTSNLDKATAQIEAQDEAQEQDQMAEVMKNSDTTLDDLVSPEELAAEMNPAAAYGAQFLRQTPTPSAARLYILVNKAQKGTSPTAQTMQVYLDGQLVYTWLVSTGREKPEIAKSGRAYNSVTPTGDFRIQRRVKNYVSGTWLAPMPFAQFLIGGIAIHATTESHYAALGSRDSGGCVRLHYTNAQTIWGLVDQVGAQNVRVRIVNQVN